jgi:hypothetical protein
MTPRRQPTPRENLALVRAVSLTLNTIGLGIILGLAAVLLLGCAAPLQPDDWTLPPLPLGFIIW